jgi:carboxypeptidase C (cathepsin A)
MNSITKFLRKEKVREAFGVDKRAPDFVGCSNKVGREFQKVNDYIIDTRPFVAALLHSGVRVLIYVGTYDWICNFVGNERVFGSLEWKGLPDFRYQQENNKQVWSGGLWWESGPLRYARVNGAGHMVPVRNKFLFAPFRVSIFIGREQKWPRYLPISFPFKKMLLICCSGTSQLKHCEFFHPRVSFLYRD